MIEPKDKKRAFMKPGRTNQEDRLNFIKYWVDYIKSVSDEDWSTQQNLLINSQLQSVNHEAYLKLYGLKKQIH